MLVFNAGHLWEMLWSMPGFWFWVGIRDVHQHLFKNLTVKPVAFNTRLYQMSNHQSTWKYFKTQSCLTYIQSSTQRHSWIATVCGHNYNVLYIYMSSTIQIVKTKRKNSGLVKRMETEQSPVNSVNILLKFGVSVDNRQMFCSISCPNNNGQ